ncbi:MAG TPA: hypothetical protein VF131_18050 [Blastocatellia bacterium]|nr:hypothetical protein [Blastocatellia bacterium]
MSLSTGAGNSAADTYDIACFRGKVDLVSLVNELEGQRPGGIPGHVRETYRLQDSRQVLEETGCNEWFPYESGRTPQEHLADFQLQRLDEQRRRFDLRLFEHEQQAQENSRLILADSQQIASDIKRATEEIKASTEASDRFTRRITWLVIILALLQVIVGTLALTSDSWIVEFFQKKKEQPAIEQSVEPNSNSSQ